MTKKPSLFTCLTPEIVHLYDFSSKISVVTDILRASSTIVTALAYGASEIMPFANESDCKIKRNENFIIAGERNGVTIPEFEMGNSPFEYMSDKITGKKIALTTTNGTQAIEKSKGADEILIGALLNLKSTAQYLVTQNKDVIVVCAGWKGHFCLEDTLFAGALAEELIHLGFDIDEDSTLAALELWKNSKENLNKLMEKSSHFKRLNKLNIHEDAKHCLTKDLYKIVAGIRKNTIIVLN